MTDKLKLEDRTVRSFTSLSAWMSEVHDGGNQIKVLEDEEHGTEYFAEKESDEDVTMIGYFKDNWGMIA